MRASMTTNSANKLVTITVNALSFVIVWAGCIVNYPGRWSGVRNEEWRSAFLRSDYVNASQIDVAYLHDGGDYDSLWCYQFI